MRKALVVGINDYSHFPLKGCINDASSIANLLETHEDGSPNFSVKTAINVQTKSELMGYIDALFSGDCETVLFYFSGHGYINNIGGYLVTPDHQKYNMGISLDELLKIANDSKAKDKIIILDCCYSGAMGTPQLSGGLCEIQSGISILTACRDEEVSVEINGHGLFTALLIEALHGGAADLRGSISPGSVYAFIDQALGPWNQRPVFKTNISKFTSLREVVPQVSIETIRKIIEYFPSSQVDFHLDPSFEDTNSREVLHEVIEPYAKPENVAIFKDLQKLQSIGLLVPVGESHMYFAAMKSKSCKLTALGTHYWQLVKDKRI